MHLVEFQNRESERDEVLSKLNQERSKPLVYFILAPSGVGKSRFIDHVGAEQTQGNFVRVRVRRSQSSRSQSGAFLIQIASSLHSAAQKENSIPSIIEFNSDFRRYVDDGNFWLGAAEETLKEFDLPFVRQIKQLVEKKFSLSNFNPKDLLGQNETPALVYLKTYIKLCIEDHGAMLALENIQNIDESSLVYLLDSVDWPKDATVLAELTTFDQISSDDHWSFGELVDEFLHAGFERAERVLPPLEYQHYKKIALLKGVDDEQKVRSAYDSEGGNIQAIFDHSVLNRRANSTTVQEAKSESTATELFSTLTRDERFLMVALEVHKTPVTMERAQDFEALLATKFGIPSDRLAAARAKLLLDEVLELSPEGISYPHDSMSQAVDEVAPKAMLHMAQNVWIELYRGLHKSSQEWAFYLNLVLDHGDKQLIRSGLNAALERGRSKNFRNQIFVVMDAILGWSANDHIVEHVDLSNETKLEILLLFYELENFEKAFELLQKVEAEQEFKKLLNVVLLDRLDRSSEVLELTTDEKLRQLKDPTPFYITRIASLASLQRRHDATPVFYEATETPLAARSPYYPYLLRVGDICLPFQESISPLTESVKIFKERGNLLEAAHSLNAIGMQLGRLGRLTEGLDFLDQAEALMEDDSEDLMMVTNNQAVIRMMQGSFDELTRLKLLFAKEVVDYSFGKNAIAMNQAIYAIGTNDPKVERKLENVDVVASRTPHSDLGLRRTGLWNRHLWHLSQNETDLAQKFIEDARALDIKNPPLWGARLFGKPLADKSQEFMFSLGYHYTFMSKWHFKIEY